MIGTSLTTGSVDLPRRQTSEAALKSVAHAVERVFGVRVSWEGDRRFSFKVGLGKMMFSQRVTESFPLTNGATVTARDGKLAFELHQRLWQGIAIATICLSPLLVVFVLRQNLTMLLMIEMIASGFIGILLVAFIAKHKFAQFIENNTDTFAD